MITTLLLFLILAFFENYNMTDQIYSFSIKIEQFEILYPIFIENILFGAGIGFFLLSLLWLSQRLFRL